MGRYRSQQIAFRNALVEAPIDFTALPEAVYHNGKIVRCNPLVAGQGYFYMVSDGTYWRPYGGEQKLYVLAAPIDMAVNNSAQLLVQVPIPPGLIPDGRAYLKTVLGADKLLGTTDTCTTYQRLGPLGTAGDPTLFGATMTTTNISIGTTQECNRTSSTTVRKHGNGNAYANNALSGVSTAARAAAITVGNLDTTTNYFSVFLQMTTGTTEYGQLHSFTLEIMG
jgi:hypothetical protein